MQVVASHIQKNIKLFKFVATKKSLSKEKKQKQQERRRLGFSVARGKGGAMEEQHSTSSLKHYHSDDEPVVESIVDTSDNDDDVDEGLSFDDNMMMDDSAFEQMMNSYNLDDYEGSDHQDVSYGLDEGEGGGNLSENNEDDDDDDSLPEGALFEEPPLMEPTIYPDAETGMMRSHYDGPAFLFESSTFHLSDVTQCTALESESNTDECNNRSTNFLGANEEESEDEENDDDVSIDLIPRTYPHDRYWDQYETDEEDEDDDSPAHNNYRRRSRRPKGSSSSSPRFSSRNSTPKTSPKRSPFSSFVRVDTAPEIPMYHTDSNHLTDSENAITWEMMEDSSTSLPLSSLESSFQRLNHQDDEGSPKETNSPIVTLKGSNSYPSLRCRSKHDEPDFLDEDQGLFHQSVSSLPANLAVARRNRDDRATRGQERAQQQSRRNKQKWLVFLTLGLSGVFGPGGLCRRSGRSAIEEEEENSDDEKKISGTQPSPPMQETVEPGQVSEKNTTNVTVAPSKTGSEEPSPIPSNATSAPTKLATEASSSIPTTTNPLPQRSNR